MNIGNVGIRTNPQLEGVVEALSNIVNSMKGARDKWWEDEEVRKDGWIERRLERGYCTFVV